MSPLKILFVLSFIVSEAALAKSKERNSGQPKISKSFNGKPTLQGVVNRAFAKYATVRTVDDFQKVFVKDLRFERDRKELSRFFKSVKRSDMPYMKIIDKGVLLRSTNGAIVRIEFVNPRLKQITYNGMLWTFNTRSSLLEQTRQMRKKYEALKNPTAWYFAVLIPSAFAADDVSGINQAIGGAVNDITDAVIAPIAEHVEMELSGDLATHEEEYCENYIAEVLAAGDPIPTGSMRCANSRAAQTSSNEAGDFELRAYCDGGIVKGPVVIHNPDVQKYFGEAKKLFISGVSMPDQRARVLFGWDRPPAFDQSENNRAFADLRKESVDGEFYLCRPTSTCKPYSELDTTVREWTEKLRIAVLQETQRCLKEYNEDASAWWRIGEWLRPASEIPVMESTRSAVTR